MNRINQIKSSFSINSKMSIGRPNEKNPDDVVIVSAIRTPLTKAVKGSLKDTSPEALLAHVLRETISRTKIDPMIIQDVIVGNVLQPSAGAFPARMAQFLADMPFQVPVSCVNRFCASGLESCALIAAKIKAGFIDVGIGAGVESMSFYQFKHMLTGYKFGEEINKSKSAQKCLIPMGQTSDNICQQFSLERKDLDKFAVESHKKAHFASKNGLFEDEIVPIETLYKEKDGSFKKILVSKDEGIRADSNLESLSKLKPVFTKDGLTTSGNSSQMTDGASAVLLMRRSVAEKLGLVVLGKMISHVVIGVPPEIMGIGPSEAIPLAVEASGLKMSDIDVFEINEAFASVVVFAMKKLNIDSSKVNPKGGSIAFGHPLGCTGARQFATILPELKRTNKKFGVISMCLGSGMGAACVIERE